LMSVRDQLRVHLEDFAVLTYSLVECASSTDLRIKMTALVEKLLDKNMLLQQAVSTCSHLFCFSVTIIELFLCSAGSSRISAEN